MHRNLMFYCYPRKEGQNWRRSVRHLKARWNQFTGKKVVAITQDETTDDPSEVIAEFGSDCDFHICCNTHLQEIQPFAYLLTAIQNEPGITLYAHSKGCTHIDNVSSHLWCDAMASACLDYPQLVDCCLQNAMTCGAFRSLQPIGISRSAWHFAGTWWWVRNADLFSRKWGDFEQVFWGVESYPGRHFTQHESACLFFDNAHTAHLYHLDWWKAHIGPAFNAWSNRLGKCGLIPMCTNPPNYELFREVIA